MFSWSPPNVTQEQISQWQSRDTSQNRDLFNSRININSGELNGSQPFPAHPREEDNLGPLPKDWEKEWSFNIFKYFFGNISKRYIGNVFILS